MIGHIIKFSFVMTLVTLLFYSQEGFAMAQHVHFVDAMYEGKVIKGQPVGEMGTRFEYQTADYLVFINYPTDHRAGWPLKQRMTLQVDKFRSEELSFKVVYWKLMGQNKNEIALTHGIKNHDSLVEREFPANGIPLDFFSDIPDSVDQLTLEFKIEIKTPSGVDVVEKKIPLKRTQFKTSMFEGLLH